MIVTSRCQQADYSEIARHAPEAQKMAIQSPARIIRTSRQVCCRSVRKLRKRPKRALGIELLCDRVAMAADSLALEPYSTGWSSPLVLTHSNDDSGRVFVAEQSGTIHIVRDGQRDPNPFLDISDRVLPGGERGLLGLAFHPDYASDNAFGKGKFYVYYSARSLAGDHQSIVSEFTVSSRQPDLAHFSTERVLLAFAQPFANHNGGDLAFGPSDGMLYVSSGDGGSGGDPQGNGQDGSTLLGGIMRIDVSRDDFPLEAQRNFGIPDDNPFIDDPDVRDEWFAIGLRNPYRMSFDDRAASSGEGDVLYVGDVGQNAFEEVNRAVGGENFGWNVCEGDHVYRDTARSCPDEFASPIAEYSRDEGISVIGGYVYRGDRSPVLQGVYVFGDFNGTLMTLEQNQDGSFTREIPAITANAPATIIGFGRDQAEELYVLSFGGIHTVVGEQGAAVSFDQASTITIRRDDDDLVLSETVGSDQIEHFRQPVIAISALSINGSSDDDHFILETLDPATLSKIRIDGLEGYDRLSVNATSSVLSVASIAPLISTIEEIDLRGGTSLTVSIEPTDLRFRDSDLQVQDSEPALRLRYDELDLVELDGTWMTLEPISETVGNGVSGQQVFWHRVDSDSGQLLLQNHIPYSNPVNRFDVNRDQIASALDVLQIINALDKFGGDLETPSLLRSPHQYYDVNEDNRLTALDALQAINQLSRQRGTPTDPEFYEERDWFFANRSELEDENGSLF